MRTSEIVLLACTLGATLMTTAETPPPKHILVQGHRGARARLPENTVPAFEYAIRAGADVLELDLAVTKDNVLVVSHDPILEAPICTGPRDKAVIHDLTLDELRQWDCGAQQNPHFPKQHPVPGTRMPTLDEVLSLAGQGKFEFNIETKSFPDKPQYTPTPDVFAELVLRQIRKHRLEKRVIVQSFDFRTLRAMKKLAPNIRLAALTESDSRPFAEIAKEGDATIISPHYSLVTPAKTAEAHKAGLQVVPWTADTPDVWQRLVDARVDSIITDDPEVLIDWLKHCGLR